MFEKSPILIVIDGFRRFWLDVDRAKLVPYVAGGDGPVDENAAPEVPANFDGLTEEDLRDLHARLEARFTAEKPEAKTRTQVDALRGYREAQTRIASELTRRQTEAIELADALTSMSDTPPLPEAPDPNAEPAPEVPPAEPDPNAAHAEGEPAAAPTPEAIAAGLTAGGVAGGRAPQTAAEQAATGGVRTRPRAAMTAAAGQNIVGLGTEVGLQRMGEIADAVKGKLNSKHEQVKAIIASLPSFEEMPELGVPLLSKNNAVTRNDELIREAVDAHMARRAERMGLPAPRTAAICDPLDIIREIPDYVSQADPLTAALPNRPIGRLGFNFTPAVKLSDVSSGVQSGWDDSDQSSVDPDDSSTWKPCLDATCGSPCEVTADAATACLTFDVTTEMSNPERIRDLMSKLTALRIRNRTIGLLDIMDGLSARFTRTGDYSLMPDTIYAVEKAFAWMRYGERLDQEDYTLFLPHGFSNFLAIDVHGQSFVESEDLNAGAADMVRRLASILGVEVVELRDETDTTWDTPFPAAGSHGNLDDTPCAWPLRLIHTPSALYGSTGVIDTGVQSDPQLARQNKRQWFQEEFSLLTKHGSPPWAKITLTSAASGSRAAASTKLACA